MISITKVNPLYLFICSFLFIRGLSAQAELKTFFIVEDPQQFEILNRYQQRVPDYDKILFQAFAPWVVLENETTLSDQFTKAMKINFDGKIYFLKLNEENKPFSKSENYYSNQFQNVIPINDSVTVIQNKAVIFRNIPFGIQNSRFKQTYINKDNRLLRLFFYNNSYFVKDLSKNDSFGWIKYSSPLSIKKISKMSVAADTLISEDLIDLVRAKIAAINTVYKNLFEHLNRKFNQNKKAPVWSFTSNNKGIVLQFESEYNEKYKKTTSYFADDIKSIFSDPKYEIQTTDSVIEIRQRD